MMNIQEFVKKHNIIMTAQNIAKRTNIEWSNAYHYICVFNDGELIIEYSMGYAHTEPPTAADVLDCLASDASGLQDLSTFEDFCAEYGYDDDSIKDRRVYRLIAEQSEELDAFLGDDAYNELLWEVERM